MGINIYCIITRATSIHQRPNAYEYQVHDPEKNKALFPLFKYIATSKILSFFTVESQKFKNLIENHNSNFVLHAGTIYHL